MNLESQRPYRMWRWAPFVLLAGIFAVAIVVGLISRAVSPGAPGPVWFPFAGFWVFFVFFALFWAVRWFFWPWGWGWGYSRRVYWHGDESYYILRARFARGEITKEQYDQMMRDLGHQP
ncbi:MAG TPA: SHOCT domain-containing protein [Thermoplasmata archaeon]|nr:SHOCT domain-containing protein [Thermoplasmata archaeon]